MKVYFKRFSARIIDIFIFDFLISSILFSFNYYSGIDLKGILLDAFVQDHSRELSFRFPYLWWMIGWGKIFLLMTFLTVFFLAPLMAVFGMTPGKVAMGLRIRAPEGRVSFLSRLGFFLAREMRVWISGLGCGFLFISPLFILWQALRIRSGKPAFYDRYEPAVFEVKKIPIIPFLLWTLLAVILIGLTVTKFFYSLLMVRQFLRYFGLV